jgi:hypothetical protein
VIIKGREVRVAEVLGRIAAAPARGHELHMIVIVGRDTELVLGGTDSLIRIIQSQIARSTLFEAFEGGLHHMRSCRNCFAESAMLRPIGLAR